jgi:hypothetical protein
LPTALGTEDNQPMSRRFQFSLRAMLVAIAPLVLALGCVPSENPLLTEEESAVDAELLGVWRFDNDDTGPFSIRRKSGSETLLEAVRHGDPLEMRLMKIGDERFMSLELFEDQTPNMILRYEVIGNEEVRFYELDQAIIHDAIKKDELSGRVWVSLFGPRASLSSGSADIRAYLERHGKDCFNRKPTFSWKRIEPEERK